MTIRIALAICILLLARPVFAGEAARPTLDAEIGFHAVRAIPDASPERALAIAWLAAHGGPRAIAPLVHLMRWSPDDREAVVAALERLAGENIGQEWFNWMLWLQKHPEIEPYDGFGNFLAATLVYVDPRFLRFVHHGIAHEIRLDEIVWGGVRVDGIPALDSPKMISAAEAKYLNADDRVFGVEINGDARAYPLRIANWHEMVNDIVGGVPVSLAYCTLCGAGILFDGRADGREPPFTFGSSGLLYRSNKLMYDRSTDSLWNQFTGRPVVGPLVGSGIQLKILPLVTTTWSAWLKRHPNSRVLSIDTGFARDYGPGVAYANYFASKDLMFPALVKDRRVAQKDLVFGLRVPGGTKAWPLAAFAGGKVINDRVGFVDVVLVGDADTRAVRAYESDGLHFSAASEPDMLQADGGAWRVTEDALVGLGGRSLPRLPGHIAYWFAWAGYFEDAQLGGSGN
ncbi:MAG: DUF3179 domain-containing protein [Proteobacteria bacterium]|nr:DUF3179 domain-containing protein [Pseudomonadota bacterium]